MAPPLFHKRICSNPSVNAGVMCNLPMKRYIALISILFSASMTTACEGKVVEIALPEEVVNSIEVCVEVKEKYGRKTEYTYEELEDMDSLHEQCINEKIKYIDSCGKHEVKPSAH